MDGKSLNIADDKLEQLKAILPEAFTEGKVDWEKLRLTLGDDVNITNERYVLNWAGKSAAFRALQTPTTATLAPVRDESVNFDTTENIFIEGENLEILKVLQKAYYGKIKMIYIDPPYNTGNDSFIYPDKFSETRDEYLKRINEKNEDGFLLKEGMFRKNSKDSGHYHSNWLSMMYPRLFLARNLMRKDGVFFISIGEEELHNLTLLLNSIFGENNYITTISRISKTASDKGNFFAPTLDYIICFAKDKISLGMFSDVVDKSLYRKQDENGYYRDDVALYQAALDVRRNQRYFIECPDGSKVIPPGKTFPPDAPVKGDGVWRWTEETYFKNIHLVVFKKTKRSPLTDERGKKAKYNLYTKSYLEERQKKGTRPRNFTDKYINRKATDFLKTIGIPFNYSKPFELIKWLIEIINPEAGDIVLDFFAGSCSTANSVLEYNIQNENKLNFIMVQLAEETDTPGFSTIAEIGMERIRRIINKIKEENPLFAKQELDLGFKVFKLKHSNFKLWRGDGIEKQEELEKQLEILVDPVRPEAIEEHMLFELILKSGFPLITQIEKQEAGKAHYYLVGGELAIALSHLDESTIKDILKNKPQQVICLDSLFVDNDPMKTNSQLQFKDAGITFHSI